MGRIAIITMLLSTVVGCEPLPEVESFEYDEPTESHSPLCKCDNFDKVDLMMVHMQCVQTYKRMTAKDCYLLACDTACKPKPIEWSFK